jgi:hypothetical protein
LQRSKEQGTPPDLTFRPDIGNSTLILKQSNGHDILEETCRQRVERLAYKDKEQVAHAREKAAVSFTVPNQTALYLISTQGL